MSLKDIKDGIEKGSVLFGFKQAVKGFNPKKKMKVFVAKDVRQDILDRLNELGMEPEFLRTKQEITKELNLDFECETFLIK